jgi:hypothetical protein
MPAAFKSLSKTSRWFLDQTLKVSQKRQSAGLTFYTSAKELSESASFSSPRTKAHNQSINVTVRLQGRSSFDFTPFGVN